MKPTSEQIAKEFYAEQRKHTGMAVLRVLAFLICVPAIIAVLLVF